MRYRIKVHRKNQALLILLADSVDQAAARLNHIGPFEFIEMLSEHENKKHVAARIILKAIEFIENSTTAWIA